MVPGWWAAIRPLAALDGPNTKLHLAVDAHGMSANLRVAAGTVADYTQAAALLDGIAAEHLLADRGYDTNRVLAAARERGMTPVIPSKRNRKVAREYDAVLYQARHLVANGFERFKAWQRVMRRLRCRTWRFARYGLWLSRPG